MQTLRKKTSPCKYRNDPGRFFGDGVQFKAKLIGILEVGEARGDRMCQEALQDLKMAIRAAGEHKQRITIHVTIEGLRLRDEKTGDSLYHHPVHKISFIAQDMSDSRAFGYIFGSPDSGHRFFGIKTDKQASQVVLAMRDLFQVVFELKKKEIELARQHLTTKAIHEQALALASISSMKSTGGHHDLGTSSSGVGAGGNKFSMLDSMDMQGGPNITILGVNFDTRGAAKEMSPESVADLVDLEQELSSIQRGITQMERITPSEPVQPGAIGSSSKTPNEKDPFGDSFTNFPSYNLLPPPESSRSRNKLTKSVESNVTSNAPSSKMHSSLLSPAAVGSSSPAAMQQQHDDDDSWLNELDQQNDVFDTSKTGAMGLGSGIPMAPLAPSESTRTPTQQLSVDSTVLPDIDISGGTVSTVGAANTSVNASANSTTSNNVDALSSLATTDVTQPTTTKATTAVKSDAFTDLDPLGTGRTRPYVDKKYFFQELKNPPKKVLKDLSSSATCGSTNGGNNSDVNNLTLPNYTTAVAVVDEFLSKDGIFDDSCIRAVAKDVALATTSTATASKQQSDFERQQQQLQPLNFTNTNNNTADSVSATATGGDPVMLPRDTDPFSPTRKKSDPFQEGGDIFSKLDPFEFEFPSKSNSGSSSSKNKNESTPQQQRISPSAIVADPAATRATTDVFNGPLQVSLPPEIGNDSLQWKNDISRLERQSSEAHGIMMMGNLASTVRSRPVPSGQFTAGHVPSSMFKQQTVDVISSISNKKMPHLFGQARFSKRDSNSINMRRLQESDSLSENEAAPEPPPRPDSVSHAEPPPLPPKKQFNDIIIRPRVTSGNAVPSLSSNSMSTSRYEFLNSTTKSAVLVTRDGGDVPPIPLPSRRVGRSDGTYPGPGRPRKPGHTEDDYLAPIGTNVAASSNASGGATDVPPLLPPPTQISTRARGRQLGHVRSHDNYENKKEILQQQQQQQQQQEQQQQQQKKSQQAADENTLPPASILPDITLSQLLTLGIDELAVKLNVPTSKLSTMTLVQLTSYLSEFIEKSKSSNAAKASTKEQNPEGSSVFKVNFDQQGTFVAKFDDTFGEDLPAHSNQAKDEFIANFAEFNEPPKMAPPVLRRREIDAAAVPPADRYAVFREIIDQELQDQQEATNLMGDITPPDDIVSATGSATAMNSEQHELTASRFEACFDNDDFLSSAQNQQPQPPKIDTKITEVVAQAKDRYAALRDIILVENLFETKPTAMTAQDTEKDLMQDFPEFSDEFNEDERPQSEVIDTGIGDGRNLLVGPSSSTLTVEEDDDEDVAAESSNDSNDKDVGDIDATASATEDQYEKLSMSTPQQFDDENQKTLDSNTIICAKEDSNFLTVASVSGLSSSKDDLEIDDLMQRAISNLSLDSRDRISPVNSANIPVSNSSSAAPSRLNESHMNTLTAQPLQQFNDMSTSPIPLQRSPVPANVPQQNQKDKSPNSKSPQVSPILSQLSAVSNLIDTASKQMSGSDIISAQSHPAIKESWATFDSPKTETGDKRSVSRSGKSVKCASLHLPPPPPSNTSQNDTAESPCSSDPRDDGWSRGGGSGGGSGGKRWSKKERQQTSSSSRDLSPWDDEAPDYQKQNRMMMAPSLQSGQPPQADRHGYYMRHARRMNSCDEDYDYEEELSSRRDYRKFKQGLSRSRDNFAMESPIWYHQPPHHTWSPQDMEQSMRLRSFDRNAYERTTYGPPIYEKRGVVVPPPPPSGISSYDRRSGGYEKRKYYRDYTRANYDYDDYGGSPPMPERYRDGGSFEKLKMGRRSDYENIYDDSRIGGEGGGRGAYKSRSDYMYERDRKSFDRESVESYESASRRRRSFGSGDVYGSLESREEFRDRYMGGAEKTRSLRKGMKLRATGDIDYEQDSENDFHHMPRGGMPDTRSLQRPNQLSTISGGGVGGGAGGVGGMSNVQIRMRKSSGSSPWDGEEPPLPGQKSWKRPSSAADSERRLTENRRAATLGLGQTPSGSDGEKERRYRKKQRPRNKDFAPGGGGGGVGAAPGGGRYSAGSHTRDNYDYITYDDDDDVDDEDYVDEDYDEPPTDEDKFERLNRRRTEMHQRMLESERRQHALGKVSLSAFKCGVTVTPAAAMATPSAIANTASTVSSSTISKKYNSGNGRVVGVEYDYDDYEQTPTPRSNTSANGSGATHPPTGDSTKFSFDGGFESDFNQNSPPPAPAGTASSCNSTPAPVGGGGGSSSGVIVTPATKSSFRFSNDFSEREKSFAQNSTSGSSLQQYDLDAPAGSSPTSQATPPVITQKLRFDDNVKISRFDDAAFEDDFSNAKFDFEKEDQWHAGSLQATASAAAAKKHNLRNSKLQQRQELIKKSESINIFAKKSEDPFEDDEFFKGPGDKMLTKDDTNGKRGSIGGGNSEDGNNFQWDDDNNFAKFDENM